MNQEVLFAERQRFNQWWLWLILLGVNGLFLFSAFKQVMEGEQLGDNPMSNTGLLVAGGISILLTILFLNFRLDTVIKKDGIYVRFFPFHLKFKCYTWDKLHKSFIRQYSPLTEYGGWGLRFGMGGIGQAYNVSGNQGLQLEFADKHKLLIGTNKPAELQTILDNIGQLKQ